MAEYIKTNRFGYSLDEAIEHSTPENAVIVEYINGIRKRYIEWNRETEEMYDPKPDPRYYRKEWIVTRAGEEVQMKDLPSDMLTAGVNPFVQIVYKIVKRGGITSFEDIVRSLLKEERVFPDSEESIERIEKLIAWMNDGTTDEGSKKENKGPYLLLFHYGKLKVGFEIPTNYHLVDYKRGFDPFEYHIMRMAQRSGMVSRGEIYGYILEYLAWFKSQGKVDYYINRLVEKKYLQPLQKNYFRFVKPLESYK